MTDLMAVWSRAGDERGGEDNRSLYGPFLTAIEVMDPVLYSKIDAIFEAEYQAELEAEARMR